jgi:hypothetical protein
VSLWPISRSPGFESERPGAEPIRYRHAQGWSRRDAGAPSERSGDRTRFGRAGPRTGSGLGKSLGVDVLGGMPRGVLGRADTRPPARPSPGAMTCPFSTTQDSSSRKARTPLGTDGGGLGLGSPPSFSVFKEPRGKGSRTLKPPPCFVFSLSSGSSRLLLSFARPSSSPSRLSSSLTGLRRVSRDPRRARPASRRVLRHSRRGLRDPHRPSPASREAFETPDELSEGLIEVVETPVELFERLESLVEASSNPPNLSSRPSRASSSSSRRSSSSPGGSPRGLREG